MYANSYSAGNGQALGTNSIAIGKDSYATSTNGVAVGHNAIATGEGMSREQFGERREVVADIERQISEKQNEISTIDAQLYSIQSLIDGIERRITDINQRQTAVARLIEQRTALQNQKDTIQNNLVDQQNQLDQANDAYNRLSKDSNGNSLYADFNKLLRTLDWSQLNQTNGRENLTTILKNKIETEFTDLAGQYSEQQYRALIDGFVNRQEGDSITALYLSEEIRKYFRDANNNYPSFKDGYGDYDIRSLFVKYDFIYDYYLMKDAGLQRSIYLDVFKDGINTNAFENIKILFDDPDNFKNNINRLIPDIYLALSAGKKDSLINVIVNNMYKDKLYMSYAREDDIGTRLPVFFFSPLKDMSQRDEQRKKISAYNIQYLFNDYEYGTAKGDVEYLIRYMASSNNPLSEENNRKLSLYVNLFKSVYNSIDFNYKDGWFFELEDYNEKLDKVKEFNEKIKLYINSFNELKKEQAKSLNEQDEAKINELNSNIIYAKNIISNGLSDEGNFSWNIIKNLKINKEIIEREFSEYLPQVQELYNQVDKRIRTYDSTDPIVVATKVKSEELKQAVTDAQNKVNRTQNDINQLIEQIAHLGLSPDDETLADRKREQEQLLNQRRDELATQRQELTAKQIELDRLNQDLTDTSMANIGENSMAEGTNAFASGKNAIAYGVNTLAIGDNAVAQGTNAIAAGENATADGVNAKALGKNSTAQGANAVAKEENATAVGANAKALGKDSIALGNNAVSPEQKAIALGINAQALATASTVLGNDAVAAKENATALGQNAAALASGSVALGQDSLATAENEVSVGNEVTGLKRKINNVANGLISDTSSETVTGQQLYGVAQILGAVVTSDGLLDAEFEYYDQGDVKKTKNVKTAIKAVSQNNRYVSVNSTGNAASAKGNESVAIGGNSVALGANSVAVGSGSVALNDNEFSVGNAQTGLARRITNVADGVADNDAATVGQLNSGLAGVEKKLQKTEKRLSGGVAGAYAAASLVNASLAGDNMLSVGTGTYNGSTAIAVGYSKVSDNGKVYLKLLGSANNHGEVGGGASVGFKFK